MIGPWLAGYLLGTPPHESQAMETLEISLMEMIQLITDDNKIIYELEKSELFPDYRSVLKEAIALNINLKGLVVKSELIDNVVWRGIDMSLVSFEDCSMKRNEFIECFGKIVGFHACDLTSLKIKKSNIEDLSLVDCNLFRLSFRNSVAYNIHMLNCNCGKSSFYKSDIKHTGFHTTNISETIFNKCCIDKSNFVHVKPNKEWMKDTVFFECSFEGCKMEDVDDISLLYFWDSDVREIEFKNEERFTEVVNDNSKVIYAIDSDVVWWKPYSWNEDETWLFRGTLKEFQEEVKSGFPTTGLFPKMDDYEVENELLKVSKFLELWNNENDL